MYSTINIIDIVRLPVHVLYYRYPRYYMAPSLYCTCIAFFIVASPLWLVRENPLHAYIVTVISNMYMQSTIDIIDTIRPLSIRYLGTSILFKFLLGLSENSLESDR